MHYLKIWTVLVCLCISSVCLADELEPECKECRGKIDTGPTYVNIDVLQGGRTIRSLDLFAWKADAFYRIFSGIAVKASGMVGGGDARFFTLGGSAGFCIPVYDRITFFPNVGYAGGHFRSTVDLPVEVAPGMHIHIKDVKEHVSSRGPFLGLDTSIKIDDTWRVCLVFQYAWSQVHTHFTKHVDEINARFSTRTRGPNYAVLIEHDIAEKWSLSFGVGYNLTLSKDKEGLRGKGAKAGIVYWF